MQVFEKDGYGNYIIMASVDIWNLIKTCMTKNAAKLILQKSNHINIDGIEWEFFSEVYQKSSLSNVEKKIKVDCAVHCLKDKTLYYYELSCHNRQVKFASGHMENFFVRGIKNEARASGIWCHSTDSTEETVAVREVINIREGFSNHY